MEQAATQRPTQRESPAELALLRRGDASAFARLVATHQRLVMGLGQSMGLSGADLDDAAAEVFTAVFKALPRFEGNSALGTWIYQIACRTFWRARSRRSDRATVALSDDRVDPAAPSPADQSAASDEQQAIWNAVASLDPRQATAIELFYRRGMDVEGVAEAMGCPEGTVKTLLFRARVILREKLGRKLGMTSN